MPDLIFPLPVPTNERASTHETVATARSGDGSLSAFALRSLDRSPQVVLGTVGWRSTPTSLRLLESKRSRGIQGADANRKEDQ